MTEKRFNVFDVDGTVFLEDHKEGSYHIGEKENVDIHCLNDIADRLNTYADENEQLKSKNRGLQSELQIFKEDVTHSNLQINKLAEENEKLKQELQDIYKLIDKKIEEADKEFLDYHSERENDIILARWRALQDLKEELER